MSNFLRFKSGANLGSLSSDPVSAKAGDLYFNSTLGKYRVYDGSVWEDLSAEVDLSDYLKKDGSVEITGILLPDADNTHDFGSGTQRFRRVYTDRVSGASRIQGQFAETGPTEDLRIMTNSSDEADQNSGSLLLTTGSSDDSNGDEGLGTGDTGNIQLSTGLTQGIRGNIDIGGANIILQADDQVILSAPGPIVLDGGGTEFSVGGRTITNVVDPVDPQDAATKKYVDDSIAALPDPIVYMGTYDASTNTPTLSNADTDKGGFLYRVIVAGTQDFGAGPISFDVGDSVVNNGTIWEKWDHSDQVLSVNGQTGAVVLELGDLYDVAVVGATEGQVLTYNATSQEWGAVTPAAGYTDEQAQDAVGGILDDGTVGDIAFTYDDATPLISAELNDDSVTSTKIAPSPNLRGEVKRTSYLDSVPSDTDSVVERYSHGITLLSGQTDAGIASFSFSTAGFDACEIVYKVKDVVDGTNIKLGTMRVVTDGTNVSFTDVYTEIGSFDLDITFVIDAGSVVGRYTTNADAYVMNADIKLFRI